MAGQEFSINRYDYPTQISNYKHLTENLGSVIYDGWAWANATNADASWLIRQTLINGTLTTYLWALSGLPQAVWNNRTSYFTGTPSFSNTLSTLFDGVNDYVLCGGGGIYNKDRFDTFSISAWVKPTNFTAINIIVAKRLDSGVFPGYQLSLTTAGLPSFTLDNNNASNAIGVTSNGGIALNNWTHVCVTYDGSSNASGVKFYISGVLQTNTIAINNLTASATSAGTFCIGARSGSSAYFPGKIDEVSFWNSTLSAAQVGEIYGTGKPNDLLTNSAVLSLGSWWRMGDGAVFPNIPDSVSGFTGVCQNMAGAGNFVADVP